MLSFLYDIPSKSESFFYPVDEKVGAWFQPGYGNHWSPVPSQLHEQSTSSDVREVMVSSALAGVRTWLELWPGL